MASTSSRILASTTTKNGTTKNPTTKNGTTKNGTKSNTTSKKRCHDVVGALRDLFPVEEFSPSSWEVEKRKCKHTGASPSHLKPALRPVCYQNAADFVENSTRWCRPYGTISKFNGNGTGVTNIPHRLGGMWWIQRGGSQHAICTSRAVFVPFRNTPETKTARKLIRPLVETNQSDMNGLGGVILVSSQRSMVLSSSSSKSKHIKGDFNLINNEIVHMLYCTKECAKKKIDTVDCYCSVKVFDSDASSASPFSDGAPGCRLMKNGLASLFSLDQDKGVLSIKSHDVSCTVTVSSITFAFFVSMTLSKPLL